ncbi:coiled-coil and C2 domain-containing protein 1-like isoform X2 [Culicoides brevitarsis]
MFGLTSADINIDENEYVSDGSNSDLEAELAEIISSGPSRPKRKQKPKMVCASQLDALVAESLRDIPSDDEEDDGEVDDPDLLEELSEIAGQTPEEVDQSDKEKKEKVAISVPSTSTSTLDILKARMDMYAMAEKTAKENADAARARRMSRGLKTLKDLVKQAENGRSIDPSNIPPEVSVKPISSELVVDENPRDNTPNLPSTKTVGNVDDPRLLTLKARKSQFQTAALLKKKAGDNETALKYIKIVKQFEKVMEAIKNGLEVDLSNMPEIEKVETSVEIPPKEIHEREKDCNVHKEKGSEFKPTSILEALYQRLKKYEEQEDAAKKEENSSKARRMNRICKQYQDAIKLHKLGKPFSVEDLPTPPGFAPILITNTTSTPQNPVVINSNNENVDKSESVSLAKNQFDENKSSKNTSLMNKHIELILERQREFKAAAIEAKNTNEMEQAKEYLRVYKGLAKLLETARGGIPIDIATIPIPPKKRIPLEHGFAIVNVEDNNESDLGDIRLRLEEQLCRQLMMCKNTRDHHKAMGDVSGTNRFENLALAIQKDLDFIRLAHKNNFTLPKFHYEKKSFNIVKCNTDVSDNQMEIHVLRGINYSVSNPKDIDTYVKIEFPWPQDDPFKSKTAVIRDTDNPEYNQKFYIELQRNSKSCTRIFKRHSIKFEIYSKGGFLRSDTLIGTVNLKVQPLETTCEIHDSFSIMDGRRQTGGKLEVKVRIRNPILTKQVEQINEKWVVIDY